MNDSFVDFDMLGVSIRSPSTLKPTLYAETVWDAASSARPPSASQIDWVVLRNRLAAPEARNRQRLDERMAAGQGVGFRVGPGLRDRVIYRELFPFGLTVADLSDDPARWRCPCSTWRRARSCAPDAGAGPGRGRSTPRWTRPRELTSSGWSWRRRRLGAGPAGPPDRGPGRGHWRITATLFSAALLAGGGSGLRGALAARAALAGRLADRRLTHPCRGPGGDEHAEARSPSALRQTPPQEINTAWKRLMGRAHPDQGGTEGLASRLNAARDRLLKG